jgi:hypothetical protein
MRSIVRQRTRLKNTNIDMPNPLPLGSGFVAGAVGGHRAVKLLLAEEDKQLLQADGEQEEELVPDEELELGGMRRKEDEYKHDSFARFADHGHTLASESMLSESILAAAADELAPPPPSHSNGGVLDDNAGKGTDSRASTATTQHCLAIPVQQPLTQSQIDASSSYGSHASSVGASPPLKLASSWAGVVDAREFRRSRAEQPNKDNPALYRKQEINTKAKAKAAPPSDDIVQAYVVGLDGCDTAQVHIDQTVTYQYPPSHFPNQGAKNIKVEKMSTHAGPQREIPGRHNSALSTRLS